jgi:hypothetical protein
LNNQTAGSFATHGTIVLTHELNNNTIALSMQYLPLIQQQFKQVTPVGVCQNNTQPYLEKTYTYPVCFFTPTLFLNCIAFFFLLTISFWKSFDQWVSGTRNFSNPAPSINTADVSVPLSTSSGSPVTVFGGSAGSDSTSKKGAVGSISSRTAAGTAIGLALGLGFVVGLKRVEFS